MKPSSSSIGALCGPRTGLVCNAPEAKRQGAGAGDPLGYLQLSTNRGKPTLHGIGRIVEAGGGSVARHDQAVGDGLVLGGPLVVEGGEVAGPLLQGARSRDDGA